MISTDVNKNADLGDDHQDDTNHHQSSMTLKIQYEKFDNL